MSGAASPAPIPNDLHGQELILRQMMDSLDASYRAGAITTSQYGATRDHIAARLRDISRAQNALRQQQMQYAILQQQQMTQPLSSLSALGGAGSLSALQNMAASWPPVKAHIPTEDAFGETVAWRCWRLPYMPVLTSTYRTDFVWMPRTVEEAQGVRDDNGLGFHAWKDEREAVHYALSLGEGVVVGRVKLWGIVIHHEKGYRAQFAKIVGLDTMLTLTTVDQSDKRSLGALRRHYGVA